MSEEQIVENEVVDGAGKDSPKEDYETEAKLYGWVPQDDFRDDPNKWVDAETFVKRGREINPILRKNNELLLKKHQDLQRELQEVRGTVQEFKKYHEETEKRAYERALSDLRKEKKEAIAIGDGDRVVEIDDQIDALKETRVRQPVQQQPVAPYQQEIAPELIQWQQQNQWYGQDQEMTVVANAIGAIVAQEGYSGQAFLEQVTARTKKRFPEKFQQKRSPSAVEGGSGSGFSKDKSGGKSFKDLPKDAQDACVRYEKQGLLTREQYIKDFFGE